MASNATFEVEIYGNTTRFENSLKGVNTAMSGLRGCLLYTSPGCESPKKSKRKVLAC